MARARRPLRRRMFGVWIVLAATRTPRRACRRTAARRSGARLARVGRRVREDARGPAVLDDDALDAARAVDARAERQRPRHVAHVHPLLGAVGAAGDAPARALGSRARSGASCARAGPRRSPRRGRGGCSRRGRRRATACTLSSRSSASKCGSSALAVMCSPRPKRSCHSASTSSGVRCAMAEFITVLPPTHRPWMSGMYERPSTDLRARVAVHAAERVVDALAELARLDPRPLLDDRDREAGLRERVRGDRARRARADDDVVERRRRRRARGVAPSTTAPSGSASSGNARWSWCRDRGRAT